MANREEGRVSKPSANWLVRLARRTPGLRGVRTRIRAEVKALLHACRSGLWGRLHKDRSRRQQAPLVWESTLQLANEENDLVAALQRAGIQYKEGAHAVYVPPQEGLPAKLGPFVTTYPEDA